MAAKKKTKAKPKKEEPQTPKEQPQEEAQPETQSVESEGDKPATAMTTAVLDEPRIVLVQSPKKDIEVQEPKKYKGDDSPLGKCERDVVAIHQMVTVTMWYPVDPWTQFGIELVNGRGKVPAKVAEVIAREGGAVKLA